MCQPWASPESTQDSLAAQHLLSTYRVGPGDVLTIRVVGEDDLSREKARLTDAGTLFFPNLGELNVKGLTVGELETLITQRLKGRILLTGNQQHLMDSVPVFKALDSVFNTVRQRTNYE